MGVVEAPRAHDVELKRVANMISPYLLVCTTQVLVHTKVGNSKYASRILTNSR